MVMPLIDLVLGDVGRVPLIAACGHTRLGTGPFVVSCVSS